MNTPLEELCGCESVRIFALLAETEWTSGFVSLYCL